MGLPPGSQAAVRDVAEAYRNIPLDSSQWPGTVVRISEDDKFVIDTNASFGAKPNCGIYGNTDDAACDIMRSEGIGPLTKWVDDHTLFVYYVHLLKNTTGDEKNGDAASKRQAVGTTTEAEFGSEATRCPTAGQKSSTKTCVSQSVTYRREAHDQQRTAHIHTIYATWTKSQKNRNTMAEVQGHPLHQRVPIYRIPVEYIRADGVDSTREEEWRTSRTHTLREVQKLYGKLLHATLVVREGRAYLTSLESMLGIFGDRPFMPRTPPVTTPSDIRWWTDTLSRPSLSRRIPRPVEVFDPWTYSDASSECGIGVCVGDRWRAWRLLPGWKGDGREIGWAEAVGFEFAIKILLKLGIP
ncbi:hypothetical protein A0H81_13225 [Grifola frondosa]|uniref:Uncharacterized protein n=1 Tax=Grifola frondosa TaxID=5627 RepID=A0A1C7LPQ3_GRIFR|nr:hypothetical protein A0H81_13225 [Grifola frondosa]